MFEITQAAYTIPDLIETTEGDTMIETSDLSERSTETDEAREILALKRKLAEAEEKLSKKKKKRQKRVEKKTTRLKVTDVPETNHLLKGQKYVLREYVRVVLWRSVKYWPDKDTEKLVINVALKQLDIRDRENRKKFTTTTHVLTCRILLS
jgi:high-affinity K+ transport system ATPase subunit B